MNNSSYNSTTKTYKLWNEYTKYKRDKVKASVIELKQNPTTKRGLSQSLVCMLMVVSTQSEVVPK